MNHLERCIHLYLGCDTDKGKFTGIKKDSLYIETEEKQLKEYNIKNLGHDLFLYLRQLKDLTDEQSKRLNKEGFSIGRPYGYTFSNNGFLYLLSLSVDLFGLIKSGFAIDITTLRRNTEEGRS
ncbi:MAG: hypothetical protein ABR502_02655 [Chitinophagaceae bacterium]